MSLCPCRYVASVDQAITKTKVIPLTSQSQKRKALSTDPI